MKHETKEQEIEQMIWDARGSEARRVLMSEYGPQAKPSILYRAIVFFAAARDDNDNYYRRKYNYDFISTDL